MKRKILYIFTLLMLVGGLSCTVTASVRTSYGMETDSIGYLNTVPGQSTLYIKKYDLTIKGQDTGEVTYFVLPSYADLTFISQDNSEYRIYTADGSLLSDPMLQTTQSVTVTDGEDTATEWKVAFLRSEGMYTVFIGLHDAEADDISKQEYLEASIEIKNEDGMLDRIDKSIGIKARGNTTYLYSKKKPYDLQLSSRQSLMGLLPAKKWTLLANSLDGTNMRNKIALDLAGDIGMEYSTDSKWCDLYINGEYRGNYLLCKEPKIGKGRVDINGYLVKRDDRGDSGLTELYIGDDIFKVADTTHADGDMQDMLELLTRVDEELNADGAPDMSHIDVESFAKRYLLEEFVLNRDAMGLSYYFYKKDGEERLHAGPCWDYDKSCGNGGYTDYTRTQKDYKPDALNWDHRLCEDERYKEVLSDVFAENYGAFYDVISKRIDEYEDELSGAVCPDRLLWESEDEKEDMYDGYESRVRYLKFFLYHRLQLLSDLTGYQGDMPDINVSEGGWHTLYLDRGDGQVSSMTVADGAQLTEEDLPEYDHMRYGGWVYTRNGQKSSPLYPVFEDMRLELR